MIRLVATLAIALSAGRAAADPAPQILALVVTNNHSAQTGRPELHYADDDGAKYYDLFRMLAGDEDVELLTDFDRDSAQLFPDALAKAHSPTTAEVQAATARLALRAQAAASAGRPTELYFVFAGHGDVDRGHGFLELRDGRIDSDGLEAILHAIGATHAHVILDSCNSFFVLSPRKPGGRQIAVTEQAAQSLGARLPNVGVFLSTSAEAEVFEWSELQSGIFSHAVRSGLAGAADANHDGFVSYDELRAFVELATSRVKNPLYRPKIFAHAPGGRGDAPILELAHANARRIEVAGGATRLTVRDPDELPWIDVHTEGGAQMTLLVPTRWASRATIDERAVDGSVTRRTLPPGDDAVAVTSLAPSDARVAARGPNEVLSTLFDAPFGPQAFAAWRDETRSEPEQVYGVSNDDAERMRLLLAQVASSERGSRRVVGIGTVGIGAALVGIPLAWAPPGGLRAVPIGVGAVLGVLGLVAMLHPSEGERLYDDYVATMADPRADKARVVANTERRLNGLADNWRFTRHMMLTSSIAIAAMGAVGLGLTPSLQANDRPVLGMVSGALVAIAGLGIMGSLQPSPVEQMRELWTRDPDLSRLPRFDLSVAPVHGGATFGLVGRF